MNKKRVIGIGIVILICGVIIVTGKLTAEKDRAIVYNSQKEKMSDDDKKVFRSILKEIEEYRNDRDYLALSKASMEDRIEFLSEWSLDHSACFVDKLWELMVLKTQCDLEEFFLIYTILTKIDWKFGYSSFYIRLLIQGTGIRKLIED